MKTTSVVASARYVFLIVLALFVTKPMDVAAGVLTHGPIVGDVRPDHVQIWIRTGTAATVAVSYGKPAEGRITTAPVTDDHDSVTNDKSMIAKVWPQVFQAWREDHPTLADNGLSNGGTPVRRRLRGCSVRPRHHRSARADNFSAAAL
jgi:hypothetical protein